MDNSGGKTTVAEYSYDALGRRIRKIDSIAFSTTVYYNNNNWQVLSEYDGSNNFQRNYVYGNYIDEVLMMTDSGSNDYYYAHDHLFSPAALIDDNGTVVERYEYDAYGDCNVLDADYSKDADGISDYGNPYFFTGRRLDILDTASLKIMYYRNRYYDPETGRFITHDPLGITPNGQFSNIFDIFTQYKDGMNLCQYAISNPIMYSDPNGSAIIVSVVFYGCATSNLILAGYYGYHCGACVNRFLEYTRWARSVASPEVYARWLERAKPGTECSCLCVGAGRHTVRAIFWVGGKLMIYRLTFMRFRPL